MTLLSLRDLDPSGHTSFSFYDFLPGAGFEVAGAPAAHDAGGLAEGLLATDLVQTSDEDLDRFAALVLTHGHALAPEPALGRLADETARGFSRLIGNDAMRPRRMRLTRLSLMLRTVLDRSESVEGARAELLACKSPWDFIEEPASSSRGWAATCDQDNVRRLGPKPWSQRLGLPTQLDVLGDALWVGSHYSAGGHLLSGLDGNAPEVRLLAHDAPLVLACDHGGERFVLDASGALFAMNGDTVGKQLLKVPGKVHRARKIGDSIVAFDWGQASVGFRIDQASLDVNTFSTGDILVCNDVCTDPSGTTGVLYGICKLQGRVFKMDADWRPLVTRLGAGTQPGQLLDPIMIRCVNGELSVVNWFSSRLVRLAAF